MKKKELELFLEKVPDFSHPKPNLEQYKTPAPIAADMLFQAYSQENIMDKRVLDLGCGTGIFSIGSKRLQAKQVVGIDVDRECIKQASSFAQNQQLQIEFLCMDVSAYFQKVDTVIMNPPFGAQKQNAHADRIFIKKATDLASVVYSIHLVHTLDFIKTLLKALQKNMEILQVYEFTMKAQFHFHTKLKEKISVGFIRIT